MPPRLTCRRRWPGQSLLEVIIAGVLMAVALVPALGMMRDAIANSRTIESREVLMALGTAKLEEYLNRSAATWSTGTGNGTFAADGYPTFRYSVVRSDASSAGGISGKLMAVTATVWEDQNGNSARDSGEPSVVLNSKVAKIMNYQKKVASG